MDLFRSEGADPGSSSDDETQQWSQIPHTSAGVMMVGCHPLVHLFPLLFYFYVLSSCSEDRAIFKLGEGVYFVHVIFVLSVVSRLGVIFKFLVNL